MNQFWQGFEIFPYVFEIFGGGSVQGSYIKMTLWH